MGWSVCTGAQQLLMEGMQWSLLGGIAYGLGFAAE